MKMLMIYKFNAIDSELIPLLKKYKNYDITLLIKDDYMRKGYESKLKNYNVKYFSLDKLINGELMEQFDYIIGNPPYQYAKKENTNGHKLYQVITERCINMLSDDGEISFITPASIFKENKQHPEIYNFFKNGISQINYAANNDFTVGVKVASWKASKQTSNNIKVITSDGSEYNNTNLESSRDITEETKIKHSIVDKLNYKLNSKPWFRLNQNNGPKNGFSDKELLDEKTDEYKYPVISTGKNGKILWGNHIKEAGDRLLIPYNGSWANDIHYVHNTEGATRSWGVRRLTPDDVVNRDTITKYLKSKLTSYVVVTEKELEGSPTHGSIWRLSEIDFSRSWTDEELYKEFNITDEEIEVIESWYKRWKK